MTLREEQRATRLQIGATKAATDSFRKWAISLLLAMITLGVFWPVANCEFLNYDDQEYVTKNRHVLAGLTGQSVVWAFRAVHSANWHPLTWLSHALDVELFGKSAAGPHLVNLLLHVANTVLLFLVLQRMTGAWWRNALVAALFALHPLHVESVAWISERKDVLSTFFFMLTLWAYVRYAQARAASNRQNANQLSFDAPRKTRNALWFYWLALFFFALGLLSKPMLVTLPFVLLLLDYWPLGRLQTGTLGRLVLEKAQFFLITALSCAITFSAQNNAGAVSSSVLYPLPDRFANALVAYSRYLAKTFWPVDLAVHYPYPEHWPWAQVGGATVLLAAVLVLVLRWGRKQPYLFTGWFWFVGMLVPVIGLVQVGAQSMADRYSYVPLIGVFLALVWGSGELLARWQHLRVCRIAISCVAVLVLLACSARTRDQLRHWKNTEALFSHALAVTRNNEVAHNNMGLCLAEKGRLDEAMAHYQQALQISPFYADAKKNLGVALVKKGRIEEAIENFQQSLQISPNDADALNNLGGVLVNLGRLDEAMEILRRAIQLDPLFSDARRNLGLALAAQGRLEEAVECYHQSLQIIPDDKETLNNLGIALTRLRRLDDAADNLRHALKLDPNYGDALNNLGIVLVGKGQLDEAIKNFRQALRVNTNDLGAQKNLGIALSRLGHTNEATQAPPPNAPR